MLGLKLAHVIVKGASGGHQSVYYDFELNASFWNIRFMRLFQKALCFEDLAKYRSLQMVCYFICMDLTLCCEQKDTSLIQNMVFILIFLHIAITLYMLSDLQSIMRSISKLSMHYVKRALFLIYFFSPWRELEIASLYTNFDILALDHALCEKPNWNHFSLSLMVVNISR